MSRKPRPVEVAERLERAADRLEQKGWRRGAMRDFSRIVLLDKEQGKQYSPGSRCVLGAIHYPSDYVNLSNKWSREVAACAEGAMKRYTAVEFGTFPAVWNDLQKDKRKVVRHLRRCAKLVRDHKITRF